MDILVIDDNMEFRTLLRAVLEEDGHRVIEAADGEQGLALFQSQRPSLVMTDLVMPNKEGIETLMAIRRLDPSARVIAISGDEVVLRGRTLEIAKVLGAVQIMSKPCPVAEIRRVVAAALVS